MSEKIKAVSLDWSRVERVELREDEEKWAGKSHYLTKIAGYSLVAHFLFSLIGAILGHRGVQIDLLSLIAGFSIASGSQAWLRGIVFCYSLVILAFAYHLLSALFMGEPIESNRKWISWNDRELILNMVISIGMISMSSAAMIGALLTRKLRFWTKRVIFWTKLLVAFWGIILLVAIGKFFSSQRLDKDEMTTRYADQIHLVNEYFTKHGPVYSAPDMGDLKEAIGSSDGNLFVFFKSSPSSTSYLVGDENNPDRVFYEEFRRDAAGDWYQIVIGLDE